MEMQLLHQDNQNCNKFMSHFKILCLWEQCFREILFPYIKTKNKVYNGGGDYSYNLLRPNLIYLTDIKVQSMKPLTFHMQSEHITI